METQLRRHPLQRPGCVVGLIIWFIVLLTPCFMIILAAQGQIVIRTGSVPEQQIRIWLIQEANQSGIGISTPQTILLDEGLCIATSVSFVLWRGEADSTQFCDCYDDTDVGLQFISTIQGSCPED